MEGTLWYLDGSSVVHVGPLIRELGVRVKVHLEINTTGVFRVNRDEFQLPGHVVVLTGVLLCLNTRENTVNFLLPTRIQITAKSWTVRRNLKMSPGSHILTEP